MLVPTNGIVRGLASALEMNAGRWLRSSMILRSRSAAMKRRFGKSGPTSASSSVRSYGTINALKDLSLLERSLESLTEQEKWAAAADLGEYVFDHPQQVWPLVLRFGSSDIEDTRQAIATCVLEHLLEHHFDVFFPLLESEIAKGNKNLADTFKVCWKLGSIP